MTDTAVKKYSGQAIASVFSDEVQPVPAPAPAPAADFDPRSVMFTDFNSALAWRNALTDDQLTYFRKIDRFVISMTPGEIYDLNKKVLPADREHFYRCLSYIILGCNLFADISFSNDFKKIKLNERRFK